MSECGCEGSCPVCRVGEVENHKCNHCRFEFCPVCHGTMPNYKAGNVLPCTCPRKEEGVVEVLRNLPEDKLEQFLETGEAQISIGDEALESTSLRDSVLEKIKKDCARQGYADQDELEEYFGEEYGRRIKPFVGEEIYALRKSKKIFREKKGKNFLIKLTEK